MTTYRGFIDDKGHQCERIADDGRRSRLRLRLDLDNHSPDGFAWGYGGSGPAQLALAILADALGNDAEAQRLHQGVKWRVIAPLPIDEDWTLTDLAVMQFVAEIRALVLTEETRLGVRSRTD